MGLNVPITVRLMCESRFLRGWTTFQRLLLHSVERLEPTQQTSFSRLWRQPTNSFPRLIFAKRLDEKGDFRGDLIGDLGLEVDFPISVRVG